MEQAELAPSLRSSLRHKPPPSSTCYLVLLGLKLQRITGGVRAPVAPSSRRCALAPALPPTPGPRCPCCPPPPRAACCWLLLAACYLVAGQLR